MSRYIDADALLEWIEAVDGCIADGTVTAPTLYAQMITDIKQFPTADVVEVVRCKDCKHITTTEYGGFCCLKDEGVAYNDYCSHGERSEG